MGFQAYKTRHEGHAAKFTPSSGHCTPICANRTAEAIATCRLHIIDATVTRHTRVPYAPVTRRGWRAVMDRSGSGRGRHPSG